MRLKIPRFTDLILAAGVLFIIALYLFPDLFRSSYSMGEDKGTDDPVVQAFPLPPDTARLTFDQFRTIEQERQWVLANRRLINSGSGANSDSYNTAFLGYKKIGECDTCSTAAGFRKQADSLKYYWSLPGYRLKKEDGYFYVHNGQYHLKYLVQDTPFHYVDKVVPFRFAIDRREAKNNLGEVLIPSSGNTHRWAPAVVMVFLTLLLLTLIYFGIANPIKILLRISSGRIFTRQNVRQLYIAAWTWLLPPFVFLLLQYLLQWIFHAYITEDVVLSPGRILRENHGLLIGGLILLAMARAFDKGLSLKEEQDLTI